MTQPGSPPKAPPSPAADGSPVDPRIGATFGKYKIIRLLGRGGMGAVYEGEDAALRRKVAVKFLPDELINKPEVIERFMREAQVAGGLNHPNIIAVYDAGKDDRGCYMVMELLNAKSASSRIKSEGPYHWLVATRIIADCAAALSVAHENGIIHRDIKPESVYPQPPVAARSRPSPKGGRREEDRGWIARAATPPENQRVWVACVV